MKRGAVEEAGEVEDTDTEGHMPRIKVPEGVKRLPAE